MTQPPTINHFIGQEQVVARFKVALEAAWNDGARLPHMLMVGPAGVGKTLLSQLAGREMGVTVHERLAQVVNSSCSLNGLLLRGGPKEIIFLDEIHELLPATQIVLYRIMEGGKVSIRRPNGVTMTVPMQDITVIGATTDEYRLLGPLRDRFKIMLPFSFYDVNALAVITQQRAQLMNIVMDSEVAQQIAGRSKGTPRLAVRILESCHRYARSLGDSKVTMDHFQKTIALDGIDTLGLGPDEQRYLRYLAERQGQATRLFTLEAALGIHPKTIQTVIEPFLVRSGLVERQPTGRVITQAGLEHLGLVGQPKISAA